MSDSLYSGQYERAPASRRPRRRSRPSTGGSSTAMLCTRCGGPIMASYSPGMSTGGGCAPRRRRCTCHSPPGRSGCSRRSAAPSRPTAPKTPAPWRPLHTPAGDARRRRDRARRRAGGQSGLSPPRPAVPGNARADNSARGCASRSPPPCVGTRPSASIRHGRRGTTSTTCCAFARRGRAGPTTSSSSTSPVNWPRPRSPTSRSCAAARS